MRKRIQVVGGFFPEKHRDDTASLTEKDETLRYAQSDITFLMRIFLREGDILITRKPSRRFFTQLKRLTAPTTGGTSLQLKLDPGSVIQFP